MFDTWTLGTSDPYISITAHYINSLDEHPYDWSLKAEQLAFTPFEANHSKVNMSNIVVKTVEHFGILDKICTLLLMSVCI